MLPQDLRGGIQVTRLRVSASTSEQRLFREHRAGFCGLEGTRVTGRGSRKSGKGTHSERYPACDGHASRVHSCRRRLSVNACHVSRIKGDDKNKGSTTEDRRRDETSLKREHKSYISRRRAACSLCRHRSGKTVGVEPKRILGP